MTKRQDMISVYRINGYTVTIERLRNTRSGNSRYRAVIIYENGFNAVYTFSGHYYDMIDECRWVVRFHEDHENDI